MSYPINNLGHCANRIRGISGMGSAAGRAAKGLPPKPGWCRRNPNDPQCVGSATGGGLQAPASGNGADIFSGIGGNIAGIPSEYLLIGGAVLLFFMLKKGRR